MKSIGDILIAALAPHTCIACRAEGLLLCQTCRLSAGGSVEPRCVGCHKLSQNFKVCSSCRRWLATDSVVVATPYEHVYKTMIQAYKFGSKRELAMQIADIMADTYFDRSIDMVCFIPTAPARIRQRGFDHAKLITVCLSRYLELPCPRNNPVARRTNVRQLGASRRKRLKQMKRELHVVDKKLVAGKNVLLIDDMITTGASISAAAQALRQAGAKRVSGLVFTQKIT
jgi:ComF family protein